MTTKDLSKRGVHAGNLVRAVGKVAGGGGGGSPETAQAGGRDPGKTGRGPAKGRTANQRCDDQHAVGTGVSEAYQPQCVLLPSEPGDSCRREL